MLPTSVSLWNKLLTSIRSCILSSFKTKLLKCICVKRQVPMLMQFYIADRTDQTDLCQIRLKLSSLNDHLCIICANRAFKALQAVVVLLLKHHKTILSNFFCCLNYKITAENFLAPLPIFLLQVNHFRLK